MGCVDTLAITFPWEPLTELAPGDNGSGPGLATFFTLEEPGKGSEVMYHLYYVAPDSLELYFFLFPPNYGGEQMMYQRCTEYNEDGERIGLVNRGFMGIFVHPDTIRGELFYFSGNGTLEHLEGSRTPVDFIRTVPYEE